MLKCIPAVFLCIVIIPCFLLIRTFLHQTLFSLIMVQILLSTISQAKQYLLRTFKINWAFSFPLYLGGLSYGCVVFDDIIRYMNCPFLNIIFQREPLRTLFYILWNTLIGYDRLYLSVYFIQFSKNRLPIHSIFQYSDNRYSRIFYHKEDQLCTAWPVINF